MLEGRFYSVNEYLKNTYGEKMYKLALDGGMTCPNRDGKISYGGCIFCSKSGSGDFAAPFCEDVSKQIDNAVSLVKNKAKCKKYIAYFQNFTNTYAPADYLDKLFTKAVNDERIGILSVGTRPDCLPDEVMTVLEKLSHIKPLWVELGLQTIHEDTAKYIRRGYELSVYDEAVEKLRKIGAKVITHQIIGLPGETPEMMQSTAKYIGCHSDGIKLQLLHILKDSDLYNEFLTGKVPELSLSEYIKILELCVGVLPENVVIHRLTGDGAKKNLVSPMWSADKKNVLNSVKRIFDQDDIHQGFLLTR